jgi:hypothetical protein
VVLRGGQRDRGFAVDSAKKLASSPSRILRSRSPAGIAERAVEHHVDGASASASVSATTRPCRRQAVGLDHDRRALPADIELRRRCFLEAL